MDDSLHGKLVQAPGSGSAGATHLASDARHLESEERLQAMILLSMVTPVARSGASSFLNICGDECTKCKI
jgi:hypothetical protein